MEKWLKSHGRAVPPSIRLQLLIDTGADTTTVAEMHMRSLGLSPRGIAPVRTITTDASGAECNTYDASLSLDAPTFGDRPHILTAMEVLAQPFHNEGIDGVLGRDVLKTVLLTVDGPRRWFTVEWP